LLCTAKENMIEHQFFFFFFFFYFKKKCEIAIMLMNEGVSDLD